MADFKFEAKYRNDEAYWKKFVEQLNSGDRIIVNEIESLSRGMVDLENKLEYCAAHNVLIFEEKHHFTYDAKPILNFLRFSLELRNEKHHEKQINGIKAALALKYEGKGNYGRPLANLPENFKEKIIELKREHRPLEIYRNEIGIKKSTFYKYAKPIVAEYERQLEEIEQN